jgi:hypothetical protein
VILTPSRKKLLVPERRIIAPFRHRQPRFMSGAALLLKGCGCCTPLEWWEACTTGAPLTASVHSIHWEKITATYEGYSPAQSPPYIPATPAEYTRTVYLSSVSCGYYDNDTKIQTSIQWLGEEDEYPTQYANPSPWRTTVNMTIKGNLLTHALIFCSVSLLVPMNIPYTYYGDSGHGESPYVGIGGNMVAEGGDGASPPQYQTAFTYSASEIHGEYAVDNEDFAPYYYNEFTITMGESYGQP